MAKDMYSFSDIFTGCLTSLRWQSGIYWKDGVRNEYKKYMN